MKTNKPKATKAFLSTLVIAVLAASIWFFGFYLPGTGKIELTGLVQAKEIKSASRFGGRVVKLLVHEGDQVKVGQPLVLFDDVDIRSRIIDAEALAEQAKARLHLLESGATPAELSQAKAKLEQARENLDALKQGGRPEQLTQSQSQISVAQNQADAAHRAFENADKMLQEGVISQQKYDELKRADQSAQSNLVSVKAGYQLLKSGSRPQDVKIAQSQVSAASAQYMQVKQGAKPDEIAIARAEVTQAQNNLNTLKNQLQDATLKAPIAGVASVISVSEGELVQAGRPVVTILDPGDLWTDVFIPESKLSSVHEGETVSVQPVMMKRSKFQGRVSYISPKSEFIPGGDNSAIGEEASFRVKITLNSLDTRNQTHLRSGMNVRVRLR